MAPRNTDMMHFRLDPATQQRIVRAVENDERFENQSHLIRLALRYYLNRWEAGALDDNEPPDPPTPPAGTDTRRQRPTPPRQRSTEVAG